MKNIDKEQNVSHSFVICAYKKSPYLEECIKSLVNQKRKSGILIATSTPNEHIKNLARKYNLTLCISHRESSLADDWNFALQSAETDLVTLAHQDDIYSADYVQRIMEIYLKSKDPIIFFTDYYELRGSKTVKTNRLLRVKRIMLMPLKIQRFWSVRFIRRRILSFGSAICCPSVTIVRSKIEGQLFKNNMKSNIDWQAWEELSRKKGSFVYLPEPLLKHRIHADSTTTELLKDDARRKEDLFMYQKFWPKSVARFLEMFYSQNEKSNALNEKKEKK